MKMIFSLNVPVAEWLTSVTMFFLVASGATNGGAESDEVLVVYTNSAVPTCFFLAGLAWIVVAGYGLFKSPAGRDALRFFAGLAFLAGLLFGWLGATFIEMVTVTPTAIQFSHWEMNGMHHEYVPLEKIREISITRPVDGSHKYAPYLRYHHIWRIGYGAKRRLWFIDSREKENQLISILTARGVRVTDRRYRSGTD